MDSKKDKICKILLIIMLPIYFGSATARNIDCDGKSFHCVNSTHFMICVDVGAGVSKTVDNFVIKCPPTTVCHKNNNLECEYQLPVPTITKPNIRPSDETNDFTTDTHIILTTTSLNDYTNTISLSAKGFSDEYFKTIDVTTNINDDSAIEIYKQDEVSGVPEIVTDSIPSIIYDYSKFSTAPTETYAIKKFLSETIDTDSRNSNNSLKLPVSSKGINLFQHDPIVSFSTQSEQGISERSFTTAYANDIENVTNTKNGTDSNGNFSFIKLMDTPHDTTTETERIGSSTSTDEETNTFKEMTIEATQTGNNDMVTKSLFQNFATTPKALVTFNAKVPDNQYSENINFTIDDVKTSPKLHKVGQKIQDLLLDNSFNPIQVKNLVTHEEYISEINQLKDKENSKLNNISTFENKSELTSELYIGIGKIKEINTPSELHVSDITENYNFTDLPSTLKPMVIKHLAETIQTIASTTVSNNNLIDNEMLKSLKEDSTSTIRDLLSLKNLISNDLTEKSSINENIAPSLVYKTPPKDTISTPGLNLTQKNIQEIATESMVTSIDEHYNNKLSPDTKILQVTFTTITDNFDFDHTISNIENGATTNEFNLLEQNTQDNQWNKSPSYDQNVTSELPLLSDFSTTDANFLNVSKNTTLYLTSDDLTTFSLLTTLDSTFKSTESMSGIEEAIESTTISTNYVNDKGIPHYNNPKQIAMEVETTSTDPNLLATFSDYDTDIENITAMETSTMSTFYNHNPTYDIMISTPHLIKMDQEVEEMVTESSRFTTEYHKVVSQEQNTLPMTSSITENPYTYRTTLKNENMSSISKLTLKEQISPNKKKYALFPHTQYVSEISYPENIPTASMKTRTISDNTKFSLSDYDFTSFPSLSTFEQTVMIGQVTDKQEVTESTTLPYDNTNEKKTFLLQYENATELSPKVAINSTQLKYNNVSDIEKLALNETTTTLDNDNSTSKAGIKHIQGKITTSGKYYSANAGNIISYINVYDSTTVDPEAMTMASSNSVSEFEVKQEGLLKESLLLSNDFNTNLTSLQDDKNTSTTWQDVSFTNTENPLPPKNIDLELNVAFEDSPPGHVILFEVTTDAIETFTKTNNDDNMLSKLQREKRNETVLTTGVDKLIHKNKIYNTIDETYFMHKITTTQDINDISTNRYATEETIPNQQTFKDTMELTQDQNTQTTEHFQWEGYNFTSTEVSITNDIITPSANKSFTTLLSKVDGILPTDFMITTENNYVQDNFMNVQNNEDEDVPGYITNATFTPNTLNTQQTNAEKIISIESDQKFTVGKDLNTTNKSSTNLKNTKLSEDVNIIKSTEVLPTLESVALNYNGTITKDTTTVNVTNDLIKKVQSMNFPDHYYNNNDSMKRNYTMNDQGSTTPISESIPIVMHTVQDDNTVNNFTKKKISNEDRVSFKRSVLVNAQIASYNTSVMINKSSTVYKDEQRNDKTPLMEMLSLQPTSNNTGASESVHSQGKSNLTVESSRANKTSDEYNSLGITVNYTSHSNISKKPIGNQERITTEPNQPLVLILLENVKKASLEGQLNQTLEKDGVDLRSINKSSFKPIETHPTNINENVPLTPTANSTVNKIPFAKTDLVETKPLNTTNVSMNTKRNYSINATFRCYNGSRGRFADKNDCRKYYICIGKNQPLLGVCPNNTVFSEIKKQCAKNLSHCIRNNQFRCIQEGRFSDLLRHNIYYICLKNKNSFARFQFQCQNGFHLNKASVRCVKDIKFISEVISLSIDSNSNKGSDQSTIERKSKEEKKGKQDAKYLCKEEGKFPDSEDCRRYYVCSKNSKSVFRLRTKKCDSDEVFHREKKKCVDMDSYECN